MMTHEHEETKPTKIEPYAYAVLKKSLQQLQDGKQSVEMLIHQDSSEDYDLNIYLPKEYQNIAKLNLNMLLNSPMRKFLEVEDKVYCASINNLDLVQALVGFFNIFKPNTFTEDTEKKKQNHIKVIQALITQLNKDGIQFNKIVVNGPSYLTNDIHILTSLENNDVTPTIDLTKATTTIRLQHQTCKKILTDLFKLANVEKCEQLEPISTILSRVETGNLTEQGMQFALEDFSPKQIKAIAKVLEDGLKKHESTLQKPLVKRRYEAGIATLVPVLAKSIIEAINAINKLIGEINQPTSTKTLGK